MTGEVITAGITVLVALFLGGGGFLWIMRALLGAALKNMESNTRAIDHNATATQNLATKIEVDTRLRGERDKTMFKQLDRIEDGVHNK